MGAPVMGTVVVGMHRSGTSATARLVNLLGVPIGDGADLKSPSPANPAGYWESNSLTAFNDRLLRTLGGSWAAPPRLAPGWERDERLALQRGHAPRVFGRIHATQRWVWKDPRTSVTLPFWRRSLGLTPVVVLAHRHPLEIAHSLRDRCGIEERLALAIWERYARAALTAVCGLSVFVMPYEGLVRDPRAWSDRLLAFLARHGVARGQGIDRRRAAASIAPALRHHASPRRSLLVASRLSPEQREIMSGLESRLGGQDRFGRFPLPPEPERIERLLAPRRRADLSRWSAGTRRGPIDRHMALPVGATEAVSLAL